MILSWLRRPFARFDRKPQPQTTRTQRSRTRLGMEELETRLVPSATRLLGGLELTSDTGFTSTATANGNQIAAVGPVLLGTAPSNGATFNPVLRLDGGVQFLDTDPIGTLTTTGTVDAVFANQSFQLLDGGAHTFAASDLLSGMNIAGGDGVSVAGANFNFTNLKVTDHDVELQGSLTLPKLDGLTLSVTGNNEVVLDNSGAHLTGLDASLSNVDFKTAGLQFHADALNVHYTAPTSGGVSGSSPSGVPQGSLPSGTDALFTLDGSGSTTIAGKTVGLQLGTPQAPGIVVDNGALQHFDATVTTPSLTVGPLTINSSSLDFAYTAGNTATGIPEEFALTGSTSVTLGGTESLPSQSVSVQLGDTQEGTKGLVIQNGALSSLDLAVTGDVQVAGLDLHAESLRATYAAPTSTTPETVTISGGANFALKGNTVEVQLGDTQEGTKGLVIQNGNLQSLDFAITGEVDVAGLKLHADGLRATYAAPSTANGNTATVTVSGAADFSLKGNTVSLQLGDTQEGTKGIVIQNGQLIGLDAAVTGEVDIAGLHLHADGLRATYTAPSTANGNTETVTVTGAADFSLKGNTVSIQLGDSHTQGLVVQNGQLTSLDASVSADFSLLGLGVHATNLTVDYAAATATSPEFFELFGTLTVSTSDSKLQGITANLGTADNPGVEIVGGSLTHLNVGLTGSFSLFGVTIASNSLTVQYDSGTSLLNLTGGATVSLTSAISGSVNFPDGGLTINTSTGAVQINGLELKFDVTFGGFGIHGLDIKYTSVNGNTTFSASGSVELPGGFAVGGSLAISNGQLTDIALSFDAGSAAGIPLGDTGLFITHVDGGLHHLDDLAHLTVDAGLGLTFGESVTFAGHKYALFDVYGHITVSAQELDLTGTINLLGGVYGTGTASLKLDWTHQVYSVTVHAGIYDSIITLDGSFTFTGSGDITLTASASAQLPQTIGNLLGTHSFLTGTATLEIRPELDPTQNFVDVTVQVPGIGQAELKYDFANHLHIDAHVALLGQTAELVGDVNPDGTFHLNGSINVSILGSSLVGTIAADNNGFHANASLNVLGQTVTVTGNVYTNGTFNLGGTIHINAGVQFDVGFTANNSGFQASGQFNALGTTVYVSGSFASNGQFSFNGYAWINVAGSWAYASFTANNYGVHVGGSFYVLGQSAYVSGDFYSNGAFSLNGSIYLNIIGSGAYATFTADNYGFHASAWVYLLGQYAYVHGDIYSSGWYDFYGSLWVNAAGIGFGANFTADNNGLHVSGNAWVLGQSVSVWGDVYYGGWFDFHGSVWLGFCGVGISASLDVNPNGFHLDAWVGFCGCGIEVWGDIYANGTFSIGTTWWQWSIWVDNWGFHAQWNW